MNRDDQFEQGLQMRKQVMGEAFVDKAFANVDGFTAPLQEFVTRNAWGTTWCRDGLDLKTRSLLTLSMLTAARAGTETSSVVGSPLPLLPPQPNQPPPPEG